MSITTGFGDSGKTRLYSGEVVDKDDPRPAACGDLDELVSLLGVARHHCRNKATKETIQWLQRRLFVVGAEVATGNENLDRLPRRIDAEELAELDRRREDLEAETELPNDFILPADTPGAAYLDLARCVSRRCERNVVALYRQHLFTNATALVWLNRLSDYLFLLARSEEDTTTPVKDDSSDKAG